MQRRSLIAAAAALPAVLAARSARAATGLRVFISKQERPDVMRKAFDRYSAVHPDVTVALEAGPTTSEAQAQYLNTVLSARDSSLDFFLLDVIRPAQFAAAHWAVPLNAAVGDVGALMAQYLPAYAAADQVNGQLVALPGFADAMFLYYRKDLLDKYGLAPPTTWADLTAQAKNILGGEKNPALQGLSFQGAPIEGAVCTFLLPYWSMGHDLITAGKPSFDVPAAEQALALWRGFITDGVAPRGIAQATTEDTRQDFQAGKVVFAVCWSYAWALFQGSNSAVVGKVGVAKLPAVTGGASVSCIGGWQWGVSAFSRHQTEAISLIRFLSSPPIAKLLAIEASMLPVFPATYRDPDVLKADPWFAAAGPVLASARSRPVTPRYNAVSEIIRTNFNAVMAGTMTAAAAARNMDVRLRRVLT
jgi:trehalose/maltose transport system substrate-binding protein